MLATFARYQLGRGFSKATIRRRHSTLTSFGTFIAPLEYGAASTVDVEEFIATKRAPRTRHAVRSDLRVFYRWACRRGLLEADPTLLVDAVKLPRSLPRPIGPEIAGAFVSGRIRTRRMVALGLFAGLRCAEIAALDGEDVALHQSPPLLTVRNGKGGKDRVIPVHPVLAAYLAEIPRYGPVFPNSEGAPITAGACSRTIATHLARCGIHATPHQLRHTFGTEMTRMANGNLVAVAAVMGHESTNTTMGYVGWSGESAGIVASMFAAETDAVVRLRSVS